MNHNKAYLCSVYKNKLNYPFERAGGNSNSVKKMLQSNLVKNQRNRIGKNDTIKAHSYDKKGKIIASVYASGFTTIDDVISELSRKGGGWLKEIKEVAITNEDRCWFGRYTKQGRKI